MSTQVRTGVKGGREPSAVSSLNRVLNWAPGRDGRVILLAAVAVYLAVIAVGRVVWGVDLWPWLGVPVGPSVFFDARNLLAAWECQRLGYDTLYESPCDPWGRPLNYLRIWLLLGGLGLDQSHTFALAAVLIAAMFGSFSLLVGRVPLGTGIVLAIAACSPAIMFAVERANLDIALFSVVAVSLLVWRAFPGPARIVSPVLVLLAAAGKVFPAFALPAFVISRSRAAAHTALLCMAGFAVYLAYSFRDVLHIAQIAPQGVHYAYGARILAAHLYHQVGADHWAAPAGLKQLIAAAVFGATVVAIAWWFRRRLAPPADDASVAPASLLAFYTGAFIYLGSFAVGNNFDYRLVFLLLTLPQLAEWVRRPPHRLSSLTSATLVAVLVLLWVGSLSQQLALWDELASWAVAGLFTAVLAATVPSLPAIRRTFFDRRGPAHPCVGEGPLMLSDWTHESRGRDRLAESMSAANPSALRPLRIAHVVNEPFGLESANGVQQVVYCLAGAQAGIGQSVAVFSREDGKVHVLGNAAASTPPEARTDRAGSRRSLRQRLLSRYLEQSLAADVLGWRPDILHFHSVHIPRNVALAGYLGRAGIPYCVTVHGGLFPAALQRARLKKTVFTLLFERRYLNDALFIHALTPHEIGAVRGYGVDAPIVMVPNGVPLEANVRPNRPDALYQANPWLRDRRVFMFIGRLDPWQKGLDLLIEAFARAGLRDAALVLVGPDCRGSRRRLERLARRLGVLPQVVFTGPAFGDDRADLFAAADVFVHPSRWEGLSLAVLSAAADGKPCLITREADPLGHLERAEAAVVVDPTVPSIAAGLRRAAALSGQELQNMGTRARHMAETHFTWRSIAGRLVEAYRSALQKDPERHAGQPAPWQSPLEG